MTQDPSLPPPPRRPLTLHPSVLRIGHLNNNKIINATTTTNNNRILVTNKSLNDGNTLNPCDLQSPSVDSQGDLPAVLPPALLLHPPLDLIRHFS